MSFKQPRIVVSPGSNSLIHLDFLESSKIDNSIPYGELKDSNAYLEYPADVDFYDIQILEKIPNMNLTEKAEIYDKVSSDVEKIIALKDIVTCPCILQSQRIYAIDFSSLRIDDFSKHTCKTCSCCTLLSQCTNGLRYDISPIYQSLPKYKAGPVFLYNIEFQVIAGEPVKRLLFDTLSARTKSIIANTVQSKDFKRAVPAEEISRGRDIMTSGYRNGIALELCNKTLVSQAVREQKRLLRLWYGDSYQLGPRYGKQTRHDERDVSLVRSDTRLTQVDIVLVCRM